MFTVVVCLFIVIFVCLLLFVQYGLRLCVLSPAAEPERVHSLHCHPESSTSISCSWAPPVADYDSYTVECLHQDSQTLVYSRRTRRNSTSYVITQLEPHKCYTVSVKVISDTATSEEAQESVVTMIDRKEGEGGTSIRF